MKFTVPSESMSEQSLTASGRVRYGSTSSLSSAATASSPCTAGIPVRKCYHLVHLCRHDIIIEIQFNPNQNPFSLPTVSISDVNINIASNYNKHLATSSPFKQSTNYGYKWYPTNGIDFIR